jgi:predicted outer membrane repeat protein
MPPASKLCHDVKQRHPALQVLLDQSLFLFNQATTSGGAIYSDGQAVMTVSNSRLIKNAADGGGAVMADENSTLLFSSCQLEHNSAADSCGAVGGKGHAKASRQAYNEYVGYLCTSVCLEGVVLVDIALQKKRLGCQLRMP